MNENQPQSLPAGRRRQRAATARQKSEVLAQSAIDALSTHLCVLDVDGTILMVNRAWREFAEANHPVGRNVAEGANYLAVCDAAGGPDAGVAAEFAAGIRAVMRGERAEFSLEYPCRSPAEQRWFIGWVSRFAGADPARVVVAHEAITARKRNESRQRALTDCMVGFGADPLENINRLTALCGEMLGATCALYSRIEGGLLCSVGQWHVPADYAPQVRPEGHVCYDLIRRASDDLLVVRNLRETEYFITDPNVARYSLQTYVGQAVVFSKARVGSLCAVFDHDFAPDETDRAFLAIVAAAIGMEETRDQANRLLRESEARFRGVVEHQTEVISRFKADGTVLFVNDVWCRLLGKKREEMEGHQWQFRACEEDVPMIEERFRAMSPANPVVAIENRIVAGSGELRWMHFVNRGFYDAAGHLVEIQSVGRDITERRQAEERLRASEAAERARADELAAVLAATPAITFIAHDPECRRMTSSSAALRLLRLPDGANTSKSAPPAERPETFRPMKNGRALRPEELPVQLAAATGQPVRNFDLTLVFDDGTAIEIVGDAMPIFDAQGKVRGAVGAFLDITGSKQARDELIASREQLRALAARIQSVREEERTVVAREIHDVLAQELTRLKIDLVWLQRRLARPSEVGAGAGLTGRVAEMIQMADTTIHAVQRIATGLRPAVLDSLGLCAAIEWQVRDFQAHAGIECRVRLPEEEPPLSREAATAAFRILQESLTNVLRHARATRAEVSLRSEAGHVVLRIKDNGSGIQPEVLRDPMSIGLAGMRERAVLLGGQLEIHSQPGAGTTIELRLPLGNNEKPPSRAS